MFVGLQSRYFLIMDHFVAYFKDESLTEPRGKIEIKMIRLVEKQGSREIKVDTG